MSASPNKRPIWSKGTVYLLVGMAAGLAWAVYLLTPNGNSVLPPRGSSEDNRPAVKAPVARAKRIASAAHDDFIKTPPRSRVIARSVKIKGNGRESILKLESYLSPVELQVYYTDMLVKDWMIVRDDLTEGVGWSGVFMQIEPKEESMGIFAVVKKIGPATSRANPTAVSVLKVEEL